MGNERAILRGREPRVQRITTEKVLAPGEAGFLGDVGLVEFIDGEIDGTSPLAVRETSAMEPPTPARLGLPEVGVAGVPDDQVDRVIRHEDVRLPIEVSASARRRDPGRERRLRVRSGVPEYRRGGANGRVVTRMSGPIGGDCRGSAGSASGEPVPVATIAGLIADAARLA